MTTENDKFEIPDRYKYMTLEEIRQEKDILYHILKRDKNECNYPECFKWEKFEKSTKSKNISDI